MTETTENTLKEIISKVKLAQIEFAKFSQEKVDKIFHAVAIAAIENRITLAKAAVEETQMGIVEDKVIKNHFSAEYVYNAYKNTKTCGLIEQDDINGYYKVAEPIGVIAAVIPTTNPTSTTIFKCLIALKTRNGIIVSPHPKAKSCTSLTCKILSEAAIKAGAPKNIIAVLDEVSFEISQYLMNNSDLILATGGPSLVKAAYSSGKPAIGVGAGNTPVIIDDSANIKTAVSSIVLSKSFDNGIICASEQSIIVHKNIYTQVKNEFSKRGCYILNEKETNAIRDLIFQNGKINAKIVGQSAYDIAKMANLNIPSETLVLIGEVEEINESEPFAHEKLSPILALYKSINYEDAIKKAEQLINLGGLGHTATLFINETVEKAKVSTFLNSIKACRLLINMPASQGAIGDMYNFKLSPSLTLGCGSWGGNSVCENIGVKHLLNTKVLAQRRNNMLWLRLPQKIFFNNSCTETALKELKDIYNFKKSFIITDNYMFTSGEIKKIENILDKLEIKHTCFHKVISDPPLSNVKEGLNELIYFKPDNIIAFGGGSVMDCAKVIRSMYEKNVMKFSDMALRFMDIRKKTCNSFPQKNSLFLTCIPTTSGTGSEVSPFAVVTDEKTNIKYPLADYELTPDMAIIDPQHALHQPKSLTAASGIDALVHALESYVSVMASDYTDGIALKACKLIFDYLPRAYQKGENDPVAREKMTNAATMAGIAFSNAFLGICHSMAHKLGTYCHLPHGICNALLINEVINYNRAINVKQAAFPQYAYLHAEEKYAEVAKYCNFKGRNKNELVNSLLNEITKLKDLLDIKHSLQEYGIEENEFLNIVDKLSEEAFDDQCTGANPRFPKFEEIKQMFLNIYYKK